MEHETRGADARPPLFELHDATVVRAGRPILSVESFSLAQGEHLALLGPNGSGKSTFVKMITREMMPLYRDEPPVRFKGDARATLSEVRKCLGIVSSTMENQTRVHLPALDIVAGGVFGTTGLPLRVTDDQAAHARKKAEEPLEMLGVGDIARRDIMTLSTGQVRRVLIARALVNDPEVLVFDEPCTGLDPEGMFYVRKSLRTLAQAGKGIVLVTHYPEDVVPEIKRIVLLKEGKVFADGPKDELLCDETMSELFEVPLHVRRETGLSGGAEEYFSLVGTY